MTWHLPDTRWADLATMRAGYVDTAPKAGGAPLVLLHGGGLDRRMWADQLTAFPGRRVLALDARGHGESQSAPGAPHRLCDDVVDLLDALDIDRAVLVGLSMGGGTAVDVALEHPERVAGLVVSGTGTSEPDFQDPWVLDILETWQRTQAAGDAEGWIEAFMRFTWGPHRQPSEVDPEVTRRVEQMVRDTLTNHLDVDSDGTPIPPTPPTPVTDTWARLPKIDAPVLGIVGGVDAEDHLVVCRRLCDTVPNGRLVTVEAAAHYPNMEHPEEFDTAVAEHLEAWGL